MVKSIRDSTKKLRLTARGTPRKRPPGPGQPFVVRLQPEQVRQLEAWMLRQDDEVLSHPEAIRRILAMTLGKAKRK
jgi:hypothetical protein